MKQKKKKILKNENNCNQQGHYSRECPQSKSPRANYNNGSSNSLYVQKNDNNQKLYQQQQSEKPIQTLAMQTTLGNRTPHITGECEINDVPVHYLVNTGSNWTIINKSAINIYNDVYGTKRPFRQNLVTADGKSKRTCLQKK